ncbi:MAG TPA: OsmC family protein [Thermoanaerobaculia bacterium]|jgi:osmotically inducible protein OsmC
MPARTASAIWSGGLKDGDGWLKVGSGAFEGRYTFRMRFEDEPGTNPEELVGAAHAGCFSMALAGALGRAGFPPERIATTAEVHLSVGESGAQISRIDLRCEAAVPGIDAATFAEQAAGAKKNCPVSKALAAVEITLDAKLV